ncbi:hypothetical protein WJX73_006297 [Symbiochloris irregularis]|uniref:Uncharacterized protein n=1 Tax=Symbiochloris irregularis TaxID=706552 RepID=A0AAW1PBN1_9CHLO
MDYDTGALSKVYPLQTKSPLAPLSYGAVGFHLLRSVALNTVPILLEFIQEIESAAEEDEEEPSFPFERFQGPYVWHVIISYCQTTFIQITRLLLERLVTVRASSRLAWKLTKDAGQSAVRKADLPRLQRLLKVPVTVCRTNVLLYIADFIVVNSVEGLSICLSEQPQGPVHPQQQGPVPLLTRVQRFANHPKTMLIRRRMICHACRAAICLAAGAAASGTAMASGFKLPCIDVGWVRG